MHIKIQYNITLHRVYTPKTSCKAATHKPKIPQFVENSTGDVGCLVAVIFPSQSYSQHHHSLLHLPKLKKNYLVIISGKSQTKVRLQGQKTNQSPSARSKDKYKSACKVTQNK